MVSVVVVLILDVAIGTADVMFLCLTKELTINLEVCGRDDDANISVFCLCLDDLENKRVATTRSIYFEEPQ